MKTLRLILGDQLNPLHSWLREVDPEVHYLMVEMRQETDYVLHHVQKVCGFFLAMRNFGDQLEAAGHSLTYVRISEEKASWGLDRLVPYTVQTLGAERFEYQLPDEYRLDEQLRQIGQSLECPAIACSTEHFYTEREELAQMFQGKKRLLMESFYRQMRKKHRILMEGEHPLGGQWNFDASNRKKWKGDPRVPEAPRFAHESGPLLVELEKAGVSTFGSPPVNGLDLPVNREEALELLDHFCHRLLPYFGDYQDAFARGEPYLFHSRLSFALNLKILSPMEVIDAVIDHYQQRTSEIHISQVEGFVRQILGWREFVRGLYWKEMPGYKDLNALDNQRDLPAFFWTGATQMNCVRQSISQSLELAYAHHIQRLMILGNFALLFGCDPAQVDAWYLGVYVDAIEWVQLPNTHGMSQWADGGIMATKPYVSSANYIQKMGDYCQGCAYSPREKTGDKACPFNSLYWNFLLTHEERLSANPRMSMMYTLLRKQDPEQLAAMQEQAQHYFDHPGEI